MFKRVCGGRVWWFMVRERERDIVEVEGGRGVEGGGKGGG